MRQRQDECSVIEVQHNKTYRYIFKTVNWYTIAGQFRLIIYYACLRARQRQNGGSPNESAVSYTRQIYKYRPQHHHLPLKLAFNRGFSAGNSLSALKQVFT